MPINPDQRSHPSGKQTACIRFANADRKPSTQKKAQNPKNDADSFIQLPQIGHGRLCASSFPFPPPPHPSLKNKRANNKAATEHRYAPKQPFAASHRVQGHKNDEWPQPEQNLPGCQSFTASFIQSHHSAGVPVATLLLRSIDCKAR